MSGALITRLGEYSLPYHQLRGKGATLVTADDTALDLTGGEAGWDDRPSLPSEEPKGVFNCVAACAVNVPHMSAGKIKTIHIIGYGTVAEDENCNWILYGYRSLNSPVIRIADGLAILGAADCVKDPVTNATISSGFYVDTWGTANDYWSSISELDDTGDAVSVLSFALRGFQYLFMEMLPTSGTCTSFGAAFTGF